MASTEPTTVQERLAAARTSPDFVTYGVNLTADRKRQFCFSIHGLVSTGEIFVEVTRDGETRVQAFLSRHKASTPDDRRSALTLVDSADAYELARRLNRYWRRKTTPPFP